jgi:hypothetical protein
MIAAGSSRVSLLVLALPLVIAAGCGSSSPPANNDAAVGGPVTGALDSHCAGLPIVVVNSASCTATPEPGGDAEEPAVLFNAEGNDDDCKYRVSFTSTPVRLNQNVTFTVTVKSLDPAHLDAPVTGADPSIEGTQGDFHALPNNGTVTAAAVPGTYTIGPVKFDASGAWVTRFHFFEDCADVPESPHGHVAFYLYVP